MFTEQCSVNIFPVYCIHNLPNMGKYFILFFVGIIQAHFVTAQTYGIAVYEESTLGIANKTHSDSTLSEAEVAMFADLLAKQPPIRKTLYFDSLVSRYEPTKSDNKALESSDNVSIVRIGNAIIHKDIESQQAITQKNLFSKLFIVEDTLAKFSWKITNNTKNIEGYLAYQATTKVDDEDIEAWFTYEVPVSTGPSSYWGLPGLILEITESSVKRISLKELSNILPQPDQVAPPSKGKKLSSKEYDVLKDRKMKELRESSAAKF